MATVYRDPAFQGPYALLGPGTYIGDDLQGCRYQSNACESLDDAISSARVDPNAILAVFGGHALTASGGARVFVGPAEVPDMGAVGMANRISAALVVPFRLYDSGFPRGGTATLSDAYALQGRRYALRRGDYDSARLEAELGLAPGKTVSLAVDANVIAILYSGATFDTALDAVAVVGPAEYADLESIGMAGRVRSVRVLYTDPFDAPGALTRPPAPPLGRGGRPAGQYRPLRAAPLPAGLTAGARDLLLPESGDFAAPANWAGQAPPPRAAQPPPMAQTSPPFEAPPRKKPATARRGGRLAPLVLLALAFVLLVALAAAVLAAARRRPPTDPLAAATA